MLPEFLKKLDIGQLKLAAVAVLIIVIFVVYKWRKGKKEKVQPKKKTPSKSTKETKKRSSKAKSKPKDDDEGGGGEGESGDENMSNQNGDDEIDENLRGDAEELFNLAHEGLAKGMQKNDFKTLVGDLADDYTFIQLKQLYNDRERRNMNPLTTIHVTDYIKILQKEGEE